MSRTDSQPIALTVRQAVDILRADPSMSNEALFLKLGRSAGHAAAEARRIIRSEWARTSRTAAAPSAPPPGAAPDVDAAMERLAAALAATGQRLVSVTVSTTTTLTPRGGAS